MFAARYYRLATFCYTPITCTMTIMVCSKFSKYVYKNADVCFSGAVLICIMLKNTTVASVFISSYRSRGDAKCCLTDQAVKCSWRGDVHGDVLTQRRGSLHSWVRKGQKLCCKESGPRCSVFELCVWLEINYFLSWQI